jgi:hypothetical protein
VEGQERCNSCQYNPQQLYGSYEKKKREAVKPAIVVNYNKEIGSVDLADNYMHYYAMARNQLKKYI